MLGAVCRLGSKQAHPTARVLEAAEHLLQYAATYPDASSRFHYGPSSKISAGRNPPPRATIPLSPGTNIPPRRRPLSIWAWTASTTGAPDRMALSLNLASSPPLRAALSAGRPGNRIKAYVGIGTHTLRGLPLWAQWILIVIRRV